MKIGFTPRQVTRLTGVPYSTLNLWAKNGLVPPTIAVGAGSGSERIYSFSDLAALKVAFELRKSGVTTRSLKKVVEFLRKNVGMEAPLSEARLVVSGRDVLVVRNQRQLMSALANPGQGCLSFVVDLPRSIGEIVHLAKAEGTFATGITAPEHNPRPVPKRPVSGTAQRQRKRSAR